MRFHDDLLLRLENDDRLGSERSHRDAGGLVFDERELPFVRKIIGPEMDRLPCDVDEFGFVVELGDEVSAFPGGLLLERRESGVGFDVVDG